MPITFPKVVTPNAVLSRLGVSLMVVVMIGAIGGAPALAVTPRASWTISSVREPTSPQRGGDVTYVVTATNTGGAAADGSASQIEVSDVLPAGVTPIAISGLDVVQPIDNAELVPPTGSCSLATLSCVDLNVVPPGDEIILKVDGAVSSAAPPNVVNTARIEGGGASSKSVTEMASLGAPQAGFGFQAFTAESVDAEGAVDTHAGDHPYSATTNFASNTTSLGPEGNVPSQDVKDLTVNLPPGFIGDPTAAPQCKRYVAGTGKCPSQSQVGVATVALKFKGESNQDYYLAPVYNLVPSEGEVAEFGFHPPASVPFDVTIAVHVRTGGDYGVTAVVSDISQNEEVLGTSLTLWGVPGDASHDAQRGEICGVFTTPKATSSCEGGGTPFTDVVRPFLTNPVDCAGQALVAPATTIEADSWQSQGVFVSAPAAVAPAVTGCGLLRFEPGLAVTPDTTQADAPTGLGVDLQVPQTDSPNTLATPELKDATVTLPAGLSVSPSAADGLQACPDAQFALSSSAPGSCPPASQIATVKVTTPLLASPLEGQVFVAQPLCGPCTNADAADGNLFRLFLQAQGSGVVVKLAGTVSVNPGTGRLTATFKNNPQLPFSDLKLQFKGGPRAPLATPQTCGVFTTTSDLVPWSAPETSDATPSSSFGVDWNGAGGACPASPPFGPSFAAGTTVPKAGGYTPFTLTLARSDREQDLSQIQVHMPPGLLGTLASVPLCGEPQAAAGTCSQASRIGTTTVAAGPGSDPFYLSGPVYLTGPYNGGPFGLSVAVPAVAGPFNLGMVVVRAAITIDPQTAAVTVTSGALPQIVDGVPVRLRTVNVTVDRPGFIFNPTSCSGQSVAATIASAQGATAAVSSPFAVGGCASLPFKPRFAASTQAKTSKANGASLTVKVSSGSGQANIAKVDLQLPRTLPSRLTTLQKACTEAQFNANPAGCPAGSVIGMARAITPVLNVPLTGPAILVSHGGAAFPDVEFILQGQGVTVVLDGKTQIKKGVTYSHFDAVPDAPISSFETVLPEGPHSVLAAYTKTGPTGSFCGTSLVMPTTLTGQSGAVVKQTTKIVVNGCPKAKKAKQARKARSSSRSHQQAHHGKGRR
jgi:uncharacterized repeat protein (TIGR01451 family)